MDGKDLLFVEILWTSGVGRGERSNTLEVVRECTACRPVEGSEQFTNASLRKAILGRVNEMLASSVSV